MPNDTVKGRISTLRHTIVSQIAKEAAKKYTREDYEYAKKMQIEILCEGNSALWETCVVCGSPTKCMNDHFISLIKDKKPQLFGSHPLNMVHCCPTSKCNNEHNKKKVFDNSERHRKYREFIETTCPKLENIDKIQPLFDKAEAMMEELDKDIRILFNK